MNLIKRVNKKVWIIVAVVIAIQILFDPLSSILHMSQDVKAKLLMPSARQKWESQSVTHYSFDVYVFAQICILGANIEVDDGIVVHAGRLTNPDPWDLPQGIPQNPGFPPDMWFLCDYQNYTVSNLFYHLEKRVQTTQLEGASISFDHKYGFISNYRFGSPGGHGLLSPRISDCCGGFRIWNFQVLDK